jgi:hypothetical protein
MMSVTKLCIEKFNDNCAACSLVIKLLTIETTFQLV